jgi:hypothetical protein
LIKIIDNWLLYLLAQACGNAIYRHEMRYPAGPSFPVGISFIRRRLSSSVGATCLRRTESGRPNLTVLVPARVSRLISENQMLLPAARAWSYICLPCGFAEMCIARSDHIQSPKTTAKLRVWLVECNSRHHEPGKPRSEVRL